MLHKLCLGKKNKNQVFNLVSGQLIARSSFADNPPAKHNQGVIKLNFYFYFQFAIKVAQSKTRNESLNGSVPSHPTSFPEPFSWLGSARPQATEKALGKRLQVTLCLCFQRSPHVQNLLPENEFVLHENKPEMDTVSYE